jgi:hypothetical protein
MIIYPENIVCEGNGELEPGSFIAIIVLDVS